MSFYSHESMYSRSDSAIMFKRTAVIIITYNKVPNLEHLNNLLKYVDYLFITDNGSNQSIVNSLVLFSKKISERVILTLNDKNCGLSKPINTIIKRFNSYGIFWFYILDQDSIADDRLFLESPKTWRKCENNGIKVGIVVPVVGDQLKQLGSDLSFKTKVSTIKSAITSGIYTNIRVFETTGGFDEHFFVYGADIDYTIRVIRQGYKICRMNAIYLIQNYGEIVYPETLTAKLFFKLSNFISLVTIKFNLVNSYHSVSYGYSNQKVNTQLETSKEINRKYKRYLSEIYRLAQKYISPILRGKNSEE